MNALNSKIDFSVIFTVSHANPNGDPLLGNRPRTDLDGYGEVSAECIKRKIRNRLQDMGENIFVQSQDRCTDGYDSLRARADGDEDLKKIANGKKTDKAAYCKVACEKWIDVRSFGQMFAFKGDEKSVSVRGPISIQPAFSADRVNIDTMKIVKSVNGESGKDAKASDTFGERHTVPFGLYVTHGSINCQLAEGTGFSAADAEKIKQALCTLFENDASAARPDGSMEVCRILWYNHGTKTPKYNAATVHRALHVKLKDGVSIPKSYEDYEITVDKLDGLTPEDIKLR